MLVASTSYGSRPALEPEPRPVIIVVRDDRRVNAHHLAEGERHVVVPDDAPGVSGGSVYNPVGVESFLDGLVVRVRDVLRNGLVFEYRGVIDRVRVQGRGPGYGRGADVSPFGVDKRKKLSQVSVSPAVAAGVSGRTRSTGTHDENEHGQECEQEQFFGDAHLHSSYSGV